MDTTELSLQTPAELLAALPHILGFVPTDDLVALMLGPAVPDESRAVMRTAIRCPITIDFPAAEDFPQDCRLDVEHYSGAILVAVCDSGNDEHGRRILHTVRRALHRSGIAVHRTLITHSVAEPGYWVDPFTGRGGATIAYTDSAATALGVVQGRVIAASRDDIEREFTLREPVPSMDAEAQDILALADLTTTELYDALTRNRLLTPDLAARAALVVTAHSGLRDALLGLADGHEWVTGRLWTRIAAAHRGHTRAELLTMAAAAYYCGGDTTRAGMALAHASAATADDAATPPHLAEILDDALRVGTAPSKIRDLIATRHSAATHEPDA